MIRGFFSVSDLQKMKQTTARAPSDGPNCVACGLYKHVRSPKMPWSGAGIKDTLIVGEGPGQVEDDFNTQWVGDVGEYFKLKLRLRNRNLHNDFFKINAANCRPHNEGSNRKPTPHEIQCCRPWVEKAIEETQPKHIWLMGGAAIESFFQNYFKDLTVTRWRGLAIPDRRYNAWVFPMFHPSAPRRNERDINLFSVFDRDLQNAINFSHERPNFTDVDESEQIKTLFNFDDICNVLDRAHDNAMFFFFDYETTGIKPQRPGHKIASMSFCTDEDIAYSFPYEYRSHWTGTQLRQIKRRIRKILTSKIPKIAQNLTMEGSWSYNIMGVRIRNFSWDTMLASHVLDNRRKFTGLKFQGFVNFGLPPWGKDLDQYLRGDGEFNKIMDAPLDELLYYGGMDSLVGKRLFEKQVKEFTGQTGLTSALDFIVDGARELLVVHENGIPVDEPYYILKSNELGKEIDQIKKDLTDGTEAQKFKEDTGRIIDLGSTKDIPHLLYNVLGHAKRYTEKMNLAADAKILDRINIPFTRKLLTLRKLEKVRNTYFAQFLREVVDGKMHSLFPLNFAITYRGSSEKPNFQNIPVRDEEAMQLCRGGIKPSPGNQILEVDYSGLEVCISACYHKDPSMIKYITDPSTDMHRDSAMDIWNLSKEQMTKTIRFFAKHDWVFPQFYGDWYKSCAHELWEHCLHLTLAGGDTTVRSWIKDSIGITTVEQFEEHCKNAERIFWKERFRVYDNWKNENNRLYRQQGFLETYMGFRYGGYMSRKDCSNYQIQGTAFHCLLWSLIRINKRLRENDFKSKIIAQIHDSIVFDIYPPELKHIVQMIKQIGEKDIRDKHSWIIVPLTMDFELAPVDQPWSKKRDYLKAA